MEITLAQKDNWLLKFGILHALHQHLEYINYILNRKEVVPYYFEFKAQFFSHFSELVIRMPLQLDVLYFTFRKSQEHDFPRRRSAPSKREVNSADIEMYLLAKPFFFPLENPFLKVGCVSN